MAYQFNTNLPHMAKGLDVIGMWQNGNKLADEWLERQKNAEMAKIQTQTQDIENSDERFKQMIGLAKQSKRSKWLLDDINAMQSAQAQAELANREKMADINKTMSETNKNNASATETMQGVGGKRMGMLRPAHEILAQTGQTAQAMKYLDYARASGAIDDDTYKAVVDEFGAWADLSPDEIKALGFAYAKGTLDPQYNWQTANNRADNERALAVAKMQNDTARHGQQLNYDAQMYGHDMGYQKAVDTKQMDIDHQNSMIDANYQWQQDALRNGTAGVVEIDGRMYLDFGNDQYLPYIGKDGKPVSPAPKPESQKERMERQEQVINFEQSAETMQHGMDLVDRIATQMQDIGKSDGLISNGLYLLNSQIGGTRTHAIANDIETLKSNVFLTQIEKMRGMGALTDTEGKKLEGAIATLNPYSRNFPQSLQYIKDTLESAKERMKQKQAIYANGGQSHALSESVSNPFFD